MRLTGSRVYSRPPPVPRMPAGLVDLMEDITKDVLRHNPPNVYEFCANHMAKLLEIRDGRAPKKVLTLEQKIAKAQQIIRERAEKRRQKYDELLIQSKKDAGKSLDDENETTLESAPKVPIHHEQDLADALEVEIFHKLKDEIDPRNSECEMSSNQEEGILFEIKEEDLLKEIIDMVKEPSHDIAVESTVLKQQIGNSFGAILSEADDIFGNTKQIISEHTRNHRSIDPIEENNDYDDDLCNSEVEQIVDVQENTVDGVELQVIDTIEKPEDIIEISKSIGDKILNTIDKDEFFVDSIDGNINKNLDVIDKYMDNIVDKAGNAVDSTANKIDNFIESTAEETDLSVQNINSTVEATEANVDNIINTTENKIRTIVEPTDEMVGSIVDKFAENIDIVDVTIENVDNIAEIHENEINTISDEKIGNVLDANIVKVKNDLGATAEKAESIPNTTGEAIDTIIDESMKKVVGETEENALDVVEATEIKTVNEIGTATENKLDPIGNSIEDKVENVTNTVVENIDIIVNTNEEVDKNSLVSTEEKVATVVNTSEAKINDVGIIKENVDISEVAPSNMIDNIEYTVVEKVDDSINITIEKLKSVTNVMDEKVDNTTQSTNTVEDIVDVDREHAENIMNTKVENSVNITENEFDNIVNIREAMVENNENKFKTIEYETVKKGDGIVTTTTEKDDNIFNVSKETANEIVHAIDEKVENNCEIKSVENINVSGNGTEKLENNEHEDPAVIDKKPIIENVSNALKSSETSIEDEKEPQVLPKGLIAQISDIIVPIGLKDIAYESNSYVEPMEEPCTKSNVIELTVVGNGNNDNYAANELTNQEDSNTEFARSALTPEPNVNLNNEDSSDQPLSFRHEENSDTVENVSNISEPEQLDIDINSIGKHSSVDDSTIGDSHDSILELDAIKNIDETLQRIHSPNTMDLETAAVTIQKVFRTFLFKSRGSTFDDTVNDESNLIDDDNEKGEEEFSIASSNLTKERRALGITRMDTVLQTVNEEKSLSLSTDDSSTLSSAATTIQAHVRGFLVRNKLNFNKTFSSTSMVNSDGPQSLEVDVDQQKNNKTVLNIHIVPEGGDHFLSRDESMITSMDLSLDGSPPSSTNLHPLGYNKNERRKQLKREDAIQSMSPPSNNSGKLSEEIDSVKDILINDTFEQPNTASPPVDEPYPDTSAGSRDASPTKSTSTTMETVIEACKYNEETGNNPDVEKDTSAADKRKRLTKMSSDEADVVTPFVSNEDKDSLSDSDNTLKLLHSGEFHDIVLPTKVSRTDTAVVREFKQVLVYFLKWNNS